MADNVGFPNRQFSLEFDALKLFFTLNFLVLCNLVTIAQNMNAKTFSFVAKLSPLALLDPNGPTLQPGIGLNWKQRWGIHSEYGFSFNPFGFVQNSRKADEQTTRYRAELRYYPFNKNDRDIFGKLFWAAEAFGAQQTYSRIGGRYTEPVSGTVLAFDTARVSRSIKGFSAKAGYEMFLGKKKRMMVEASGGLGMRQINVRHSKFGNVSPQPGGTTQAIVDLFRIKANDEYEGSKNKPHLSLAIRVGYRIF